MTIGMTRIPLEFLRLQGPLSVAYLSYLIIPIITKNTCQKTLRLTSLGLSADE